MLDVRVDAFVVDDGVGWDLRGEHHAFEGLTTAQGDIYLSWGKRQTGVDDGALEGEALTLVDGDGPRQSQGQLRELTQHLCLYFACLWIQRVASVLPFQWFHLDSLSVARTVDHQTVVVSVSHMPDAPVVITVFA